MPNEKKITPELKENVLNLRNQGYTFLQIGRMTDTSAYMVVEICRNALPPPASRSTKQGMADLWILWDNLHNRYGGNRNV